MFEELKNELYDFYLCGDAARAKSFSDKCYAIMDERFSENMSVTAQKLLQYDVIVENFEPKIFRHAPFFYETGVLTSLSDGARSAKGHNFYHANGWVYNRNSHLFIDQNTELWRHCKTQKGEQLYLICGPYNDTAQHFNFNCRPFLEIGTSGIYEKAKAELSKAKNADEMEFLEAVCHGMLSLQRMGEKFAERAEEMLLGEDDPKVRKNLSLIAKTASRIPREAPKTFYEALAVLAFLRTAMGSLEGAGPNTFGRLDKDLIGFYEKDLEVGRITKSEAYELISSFLLLWDCHYDHDMLMEGYADHELENTYTLGGCNDDGTPLYNDLTEMFLRATREHKIIFP